MARPEAERTAPGPAEMREIFEPHEGRVVMVRHKSDNEVRLWWKRHDRWHSNSKWFGWTWAELVDSAKEMRLSPHQSEWEAI